MQKLYGCKVNIAECRHDVVKTELFCKLRGGTRRKFIIYRLVLVVRRNIHLIIVPFVTARFCPRKRLIHKFAPERLIAIDKFQLAECRQYQIFLNLFYLAERCDISAHIIITHDCYAVICAALAVMKILFPTEVSAPFGKKFHIFQLYFFPYRFPFLRRIMQSDFLLNFLFAWL